MKNKKRYLILILILAIATIALFACIPKNTAVAEELTETPEFVVVDYYIDMYNQSTINNKVVHKGMYCYVKYDKVYRITEINNTMPLYSVKVTNCHINQNTSQKYFLSSNAISYFNFKNESNTDTKKIVYSTISTTEEYPYYFVDNFDYYRAVKIGDYELARIGKSGDNEIEYYADTFYFDEAFYYSDGYSFSANDIQDIFEFTSTSYVGYWYYNGTEWERSSAPEPVTKNLDYERGYLEGVNDYIANFDVIDLCINQESLVSIDGGTALILDRSFNTNVYCFDSIKNIDCVALNTTLMTNTNFAALGYDGLSYLTESVKEKIISTNALFLYDYELKFNTIFTNLVSSVGSDSGFDLVGLSTLIAVGEYYKTNSLKLYDIRLSFSLNGHLFDSNEVTTTTSDLYTYQFSDNKYVFDDFNITLYLNKTVTDGALADDISKMVIFIPSTVIEFDDIESFILYRVVSYQYNVAPEPFVPYYVSQTKIYDIIDQEFFAGLVDTIFKAGKDYGINISNDKVNAAWTIKSFIFELVDAPFYVLKNALDFTIFGVNLSATIFSICSIGLVISIIKKLRGM